ncbi:hypothetical protein CAEBREN_11965 [Caenorhabditis brenneri]|uniref:Uncharacterized protein n=1 Tax=Caenorhabditis brenneri TaxID=135651 RepID=G0NDT7_CAEBE|nr:hypothetical protein CAEBREN_11965 [Caenorhabditis brenneri]
MNPPSLSEIASQKVACYIAEGKYKYKEYTLPKDPSNLVFDILKEKRVYLEKELDEVDKVIMRILNPSVMNLTTHAPYFKIDDMDIRLIRNQENLVELKLGDLISCFAPEEEEDDVMEPPKKKMKNQETVVRGKITQVRFDLATFLENNLTVKTLENLKKLDVSKNRSPYKTFSIFEFASGWTAALSQTLPSLTILKIGGQELSDEEFQMLCDSFPQLQALDFRNTGLESLEGISKLKYLQDLSMGSLKLKNGECMDEIYRLNDLKKLNLSGERHFERQFNVINFFVKSEKSVMKLEEIDFSGSVTTDEDLNGIMSRHPKLKRVIALNTEIEEYEIPGIEIITDNTIDSCLFALDYLQNNKSDHQIRNIVYQISRMIYRTDMPELITEELRNANRILHQMIPKYQDDQELIELIHNCCCNLSAPTKLKFFGNGDKRILMESLLKLMDLRRITNQDKHSKDEEWKKFNAILKETQYPQADRIVSMAIKYFLKADGKKWRIDCLETIDHLLEKIDMDSEFYKGMDKKKLIFELKKIHRSKSPLKLKRMAGRVRQFFENY